MNQNDFVFTSESVNEGHPDKVSDQISDAILDALLAGDANSRAGVETLCMTGMVVVGGEVRTETYVDIQDVVRGTIERIGYDDSAMGFDYKSAGILNGINKQSPDIAQGVDKASDKDELGAGDQGMMFGYAVDETPELMPMPIQYSHALMRRLTEVRKQGVLPFLRPDGKGQVTVRYEGGRPVAVETVVISSQHNPDADNAQIREGIVEEVIKKVIPAELLSDKIKYHINPTGRFVVGGPQGDAGLTGRKIIVDTYGGMGRHGGGAFSGKDPSKVDRSAAYMARHIAKNLVAAGAASRIEVQLAYAIGVAEPVSVLVESFGTAKVPEARLAEIVREHFALTPSGIIKALDLSRPIFLPTAAYGHFGNPAYSWEATDKAEAIKAELGL